MAIQYVGGVSGGRAGATTTASQSLSGTLTGGLAASPAAGDLVVIKVSAASASTFAPTTLAISGWTNGTFRSNTAVANWCYQQYSYKFMTGTPDTSITIPSSGNARNAQRWTVQVFRDVDTGTPLDTATIYATGTATGRPNPDPITPTTAGAWILWLGSSAAGTGAAFTAPAAFATNWLGNTTSDTYDVTDGAGYYTSWSSGAYDPAAISAGGTTGATDSWTAETLALRPAPEPVSYPFVGSGGAVAGGSAVVSIAKAKSFIGSGGAVSSGVAAIARTVAFALIATGGALAGGSATTEYQSSVTSVSYEFVGSGGAVSGGGDPNAALSDTPHIGAFIYDDLGSDGVFLVYDDLYLHRFVASGGAIAGGSAVTEFTAGSSSVDYPFVASGGAVSGGGATITRTVRTSYVASGGSSAGGSATVERTIAYSHLSTGGAVSGGSADTSLANLNVYSHTASGGSIAGGAADFVTSHDFVTSGGSQSSGIAIVAKTVAWAYTSVGGATSGGSAVVDVALSGKWTVTGLCGSIAGGAASIVTHREYVASGGSNSGGSASTSHPSHHAFVGSGGAESDVRGMYFFAPYQKQSGGSLNRFVRSLTSPFAS